MDDEILEEKAIGSTSDIGLLVPKSTGPPSEPSSSTRGDDTKEGGTSLSKSGATGVHEPLIEPSKKKGKRKSSNVSKDGVQGKPKKSGEKEVEKWESSNLTSGEKSGCNW